MSDNQDYRVFTAPAEVDKALSTLMGIINGILIDAEVNSDEINELKVWCDKNKQLIDKNPFREFINQVHHITRNDIDIDEGLENLFWLSQNLQNKRPYFDNITSDLQLLQGLCHGILADGIIRDDEIVGVHEWLNSHSHLTTFYPYDEINSIVAEILEDGVIEDSERELLTAFLNEFTSISLKTSKDRIASTINDIDIGGFYTKNPEIRIDGFAFCLTGASSVAPRNTIIEKIEEAGGLFHKNVIKKTDYLVIGEDGNPCWSYACYGRKVEKAVNMRKEGINISLIREQDFWAEIKNLE